jgi:hypothetical protein
LQDNLTLQIVHSIQVQRDIDLGQKVGEDCCSESEGLGDAAEAAEIEGKSCRSRFHESLHGLNHVLCAVAPLFVLCDPGDIGVCSIDI